MDKLPDIKDMNFKNSAWSNWSIATYKALYRVASKLLVSKDEEIARLNKVVGWEYDCNKKMAKELARLKEGD